MIKKLEESKNDKITEKTKKTLIIMGKVLFNFGYEPAFVAGLLANINGEGKVGLFEGSSYKKHPEEKPTYLIYMDENEEYATKYSKKYIYEDISLFEVQKLLNKLAKDNFKGKFGI